MTNNAHHAGRKLKRRADFSSGVGCRLVRFKFDDVIRSGASPMRDASRFHDILLMARAYQKSSETQVPNGKVGAGC
jgi:hypothetical protein